jgi:peptide maturation system protein (TIGR04066 family)
MTERIPVGIYPFQAELLPLVRNFEALQDKYALKKVMAFQGSGLIGRDVGYACNQPDTGIIAEALNDDTLKDIDYLLIINPLKDQEKTDEKLIDAARKAIQLNKKVRFYSNLSDNLSELVFYLKVKYPDYVSLSFGEETSEESVYGSVFYYKRPEVPVILVGSLVENPDALEILCYLQKNFVEQGIKTLVFCKTPGGALFGFEDLTSILNMTTFTEALKVEEINRHANNLVKKNQPDLILVESTDAVMRFNDITPNGFGIQTYMLTQAFQPDYLICCVPFELAVPEMIEALSRDFEVRLGTPIHAVQVSNIVVDSAENLQSHLMSYAYVPTAYSKAKISGSDSAGIPIYDIVGNQSGLLFEYISNLLGINYEREQ